ncbi:MAG TPA: beta-phosphoglucomutase family hydrolase [Actinomycetales bacterium]|nr:beta-phosphoglucomutase family hydrolase [Actinomycetales bacterium]
MLGLPEGVRACLFDLDGVLTDTASVHTVAWKTMFDEYLRRRDGKGFQPFDAEADYRQYVDGRTRQDGVRAFLSSRGITVPEGAPDDPPDADTVNGLGNRKNEIFLERVREDGVRVFEGSRRYLRAAVQSGLATAVVSSSANTADVLAVTGLAEYVQQRVDGVTIRERHLAGKPAPDSFLHAAELLSVHPREAAVFEDALAGVEAGRAGGFGFVVGVDRVGQAAALREHGADRVVSDLEELCTDDH